MDDDNFYPPSRVEHAVEQILNSDKEIAGLSSLPVLCIENSDLWLSTSPGENYVTPGTFAFKRSFLENHNYKNEDASYEEREFLNNFQNPDHSTRSISNNPIHIPHIKYAHLTRSAR